MTSALRLKNDPDGTSRRQQAGLDPRTESLSSSTVESILKDLEGMRLDSPERNSAPAGVGQEIQVNLARTAGPLRGAPRRMVLRVESFLGEGNFGSVVRARDVGTGAVYALKRLHEGSERRRSFRRRFLREFNALAQISDARLTGVDSRLVRVHGYGYHRGRPCLLMDCVETWPRHPTLQHLADEVGVLPLRQAARICRDIAVGLAVLHQHGVIHRDLKPANVLLDRRRRAVLIDYGLAYDVNDETYLPIRGFKGTLVYAAPEACSGVAPTPAMDLYALGVVLYEALSGTWPHPFHELEGSLVEALRLKVAAPMRAIEELEPSTPRELSALVRSLLAVEPHERPPDALEVAAVLEKFTEVEQ